MANGSGNGNGGGGGKLLFQVLGVIIVIVTLMVTIGAVVGNKVDKKELEACETRFNSRVDSVEQRLERDIRDIKESQDKMYDLMLNKLR